MAEKRSQGFFKRQFLDGRFFTDRSAWVLMVCALVTAGLAVFGDGSYSKLAVLQTSLEEQDADNLAEYNRIVALKREVYQIQNDDRYLEKVARDELGMARQGELVFLFDQYLGDASPGAENGAGANVRQ